MAKIHKFTGYLIDFNDDYSSFEEQVSTINQEIKYGGDIHVFAEDCQTADVEWDDDIDINQKGCSKEKYDNYFEKGKSHAVPESIVMGYHESSENIKEVRKNLREITANLNTFSKKSLDELAAYRAIGTVDEFRALKGTAIKRGAIAGDKLLELFTENIAEESKPKEQKSEVCKCGREKDDLPHFKAKMVHDKTNGWRIEGFDGFGEPYVCWIPDAKFCPWCSGRLEVLNMKQPNNKPWCGDELPKGGFGE